MTRDPTTWAMWVAFALASVLTPIIYHVAWTWWGYSLALPCLTITAVTLAILLLRRTGRKARPIVAVAVGLLGGQWWVIKLLLVAAFMKLRGFAP
jgi:hypothetical protein